MVVGQGANKATGAASNVKALVLLLQTARHMTVTKKQISS